MPATARSIATWMDRRRHQRLAISLPGRYMLEDRREFGCQTIDMSPGGLALFAPETGAVDERIVCYIDKIGRVEGRVARVFKDGFALQTRLPTSKREKLAEQITWLGNRQALGLPEDRAFERIAPQNPRSTLVSPDGREYLVRIIDISRSGAALTGGAHLPVGAPVQIGGTKARVTRVFPGGIAVEFVRTIPIDVFGADMTL